jgi:hypothetical protein
MKRLGDAVALLEELQSENEHARAASDQVSDYASLICVVGGGSLQLEAPFGDS